MVPWPLMTITSVPWSMLLERAKHIDAVAVGQQQVEQHDCGLPARHACSARKPELAVTTR